jgi:hypothetical protein
LGALHFFSYPNHEMWQKKEIRIKENVWERERHGRTAIIRLPLWL